MTIDNPFQAVATTPPASHPVAQAVTESREVAEIQAAMVIAKRFPRDEIACTDRILRACTRPTLAESALYSYSRGGSEITGPSIRLAEACAQAWGNMRFGFREVGRGVDDSGATFSDVEAFAWDLETNVYKPLVFQVRHWRDTKKGGYKLTDERDIYEIVANMAQRRVRACILATIPGDVVEAAQAQCEETLNAKADTSPEGLKKLVGAFAPLGVTQGQIEKWGQCRLEGIRSAQVVRLKKIYVSIRDGMSRPEDWFPADTSAQDALAAKVASAAAGTKKEGSEA